MSLLVSIFHALLPAEICFVCFHGYNLFRFGILSSEGGEVLLRLLITGEIRRIF